MPQPRAGTKRIRWLRAADRFFVDFYVGAAWPA
jgi:hypothetical protein